MTACASPDSSSRAAATPPSFSAASAGATPRADAITAQSASRAVAAGHWGRVAIAWLLVSLPLAWGVYRTLALAGQLFAR